MNVRLAASRSTEAMPTFKNFDQFLHFLNDEACHSAISPRKYAQALGMDFQSLAAEAKLHRNTIARAPCAESVQRHLRVSLCVLRAAADATGSVEKGIYWYRNNPLPAFDYKTAQQVVADGRTAQLIRHIQTLKPPR